MVNYQDYPWTDVFSFLFGADGVTISCGISPMKLDSSVNLKVSGQPCVRKQIGKDTVYIYVISTHG